MKNFKSIAQVIKYAEISEKSRKQIAIDLAIMLEEKEGINASKFLKACGLTK
jgi:hypothetical protein